MREEFSQNMLPAFWRVDIASEDSLRESEQKNGTKNVGSTYIIVY